MCVLSVRPLYAPNARTLQFTNVFSRIFQTIWQSGRLHCIANSQREIRTYRTHTYTQTQRTPYDGTILVCNCNHWWFTASLNVKHRIKAKWNRHFVCWRICFRYNNNNQNNSSNGVNSSSSYLMRFLWPIFSDFSCVRIVCSGKKSGKSVNRTWGISLRSSWKSQFLFVFFCVFGLWINQFVAFYRLFKWWRKIRIKWGIQKKKATKAVENRNLSSKNQQEFAFFFRAWEALQHKSSFIKYEKKNADFS